MSDATTLRPPSQSDGKASTTTQDQAQDASDRTQEKARELAGSAQESLQQQVGQRAKQAGEQVSGAAEDLRSVGEELRKQGKQGPAKIADRAAEQTEKAGSYLSATEPEQMLHDVEDLGRERPWAMLAGGLAVGVVAARFLKSSSRNRYRQRSAAGPPAAGAQAAAAPGVAGTPSVPEPAGSAVVCP